MSVTTLNNHSIIINNDLTTLSPNSNDSSDRLIIDGITINQATLEENPNTGYSLNGYSISHNIYSDELTLTKNGKSILIQDWQNGDYGIHLLTNEITFRFESTINATAIGGTAFTPFILTYTFDPDLAQNTGNFASNATRASYGPTRGSLQLGEHIAYFTPANPYLTTTTPNGVFINFHREAIAVENNNGTLTLADTYSVVFQNQGELNGMPVINAGFTLIDLGTNMFSSLALPTDPSFAQLADYQTLRVFVRNQNGQQVNLTLSENINTVDKRPFSLTKLDIPQPEAGLDLAGSENVDLLIGSAHADKLYGVAGNDTLEAGAGNDILEGGADNGVMTFGVNPAIQTFNTIIHTGQAEAVNVADVANQGDIVEVTARSLTANQITFLGRLPDGDAIYRVNNGSDTTVNWVLNNTSNGGVDFSLTLDADSAVLVNVGNISNGIAFNLQGVGAPRSTATSGSALLSIKQTGGSITINELSYGDALQGGAGADIFVYGLNGVTEGVDVISDFEVGVDALKLSDTLKNTAQIVSFGSPNDTTILFNDASGGYVANAAIVLSNVVVSDLGLLWE